MSITTLSSREFNQDVGKAKRASAKGPVFITERGKPSHVLLSMESYQNLTGEMQTLDMLLAMPEAGDIEFEPQTLEGVIPPADFS